MTHKDRPKLPLLVLAAGGILLGAAALQSVLITAPGPSGNGPHAISVDNARPAGVPAPLSSPAAEPAPVDEADPTTTGTVPDRPASHAIDLASPPTPASAPDSASVGAEPSTNEAAKGSPESPAAAPTPTVAEPGNGLPTSPPAKVESAGSATPSAPDKAAAVEPKVDTPPAESKPSPEPAPAKIVTEPEEPVEPVTAPPSPKIEEVASEPKAEIPPAQSAPDVRAEPTRVVKSETLEETPAPASSSSSPATKEAAARTAPPEPEPAPVAKNEVKPEPKAVPAKKPKETATAETRDASNAKPMSLGFGRAAAARSAAGKVNSGRYAANVRAAIGRHRPGVRGGGSATVAFSIGPAGGLQGVKVVRSSGKSELDQAAIASVRSAAPFPPPPAGVNSTFSIRVYFR